MQTTLQKTYFTAVDELTVFNWIRCLRGDLTYMRRDILKGSEEEDAKAWWKFQEDYAERVEQSPDEKKFFDLKKAHTEALLRFLAEDPESTLKPLYHNDIEQLQDEIDFFLKNFDDVAQDENRIEKSLLKLSNHFNRNINSREITVLEYELLRRMK